MLLQNMDVESDSEAMSTCARADERDPARRALPLFAPKLVNPEALEAVVVAQP